MTLVTLIAAAWLELLFNVPASVAYPYGGESNEENTLAYLSKA